MKSKYLGLLVFLGVYCASAQSSEILFADCNIENYDNVHLELNLRTHEDVPVDAKLKVYINGIELCQSDDLEVFNFSKGMELIELSGGAGDCGILPDEVESVVIDFSKQTVSSAILNAVCKLK